MKAQVNPKSTSNQSSKPCTVLQYPSKKMHAITPRSWYTYHEYIVCAWLMYAWVHDSCMHAITPRYVYHDLSAAKKFFACDMTHSKTNRTTKKSTIIQVELVCYLTISSLEFFCVCDMTHSKTNRTTKNSTNNPSWVIWQFLHYYF